MYTFWRFVHILGLLAFVGAHGVSMAVLFRLRTERDPKTVSDLLVLSGSSVRALYTSLAVLLLGGIVLGFLGDWWGQAWIWASIALLVITWVSMYAVATPYYRRLGLIARSMAGGSTVVTAEQFDQTLRSPRPLAVAWIGFGGLLAILAMMVFKPSLGFSSGGAPPAATCSASGTELSIAAGPLSFDKDCLAAPADTPFTIVFDNQAGGILHNVAIYPDSSVATSLFVGATFAGSRTVTYEVGSLPAGTYVFRCDVHPPQMTGTFIAEAAGGPGPTPSGA